MRLLLKLKASQDGEFPYNYQYPFSSAIYKILRFGSPAFAGFLHNIGYRLLFTLNGDPKLICISYLCGCGEKNQLRFGWSA